MIFCGGFPVVFGSLCFFSLVFFFLGGSCSGSFLCLLLLVGLLRCDWQWWCLGFKFLFFRCILDIEMKRKRDQRE